ncbi:metallophosphoesterase [Alicyclobacillus mali]|uniref:Metallophosphoesterase n=1 Tax=Alicyclobacillus mali (ex Roth et al. 2021) TaxID=1123961 RepID=A0ABS0F5V9_9BACL|nr:metallophosphoesterase [Alicyclobacillus mali (ex Roth et al. 2021)]MBF8378647.1 metallophosphoesterase [Alicyclobacillus mali (ex Roth et al. 2021)]MCL6487486.1 metallophosphoesterase [Alicyclobacillus mali (ex Roth et al. 2021)]
MAIYAIADLHLDTSQTKPMDVFGPEWRNHAEKIARNWNEKVDRDDIVLIPGDISWAMKLEEAVPDLAWIGGLPGRKILIRGNHDFWWGGIQKVRKSLPNDMYALQNDCLVLDHLCFAGTRGWTLPHHPSYKPEDDEPILRREIVRLELSLKAAVKEAKPILCLMHYPPVDGEHPDSPFHKLLVEYGVRVCVYGHLHGPAHRFAFNGQLDGIHYQLVSSDYLHFKPWQLPDGWLLPWS